MEQNARMALQFAQRGYVLETRSIDLENFSKDLLDVPNVKKTYLGGQEFFLKRKLFLADFLKTPAVHRKQVLCSGR